MDKNLKIALIGPGMIEIPPRGWGAVEIIVWKHYEELTKQGHKVVIFNTTDLKKVAREINAGNFDFVHLQYDEYVAYFNKHLRQTFCLTSHYGYILKREKWSRGYYSIFIDTLNAPGIIALSPEIAQMYKNSGYQGLLYVLRNGADVKTFSLKPAGNGRAVCLGKIESRKRQAYLAKILDGQVEVDFVGPLADPNFEEGITTKHIGTWSREEVSKKLTEYSTLLLLSDGEAAPMVVPEALAAGVSLVISESAGANVDRTKSFISILPDGVSGSIAEIVERQISKNKENRNEIISYARNFFDYEKIIPEYVEIIADFRKNGAREVPKTNLFNPRYLYSRLWLLASHIVRKLRARKLKFT